MCVCVCILFGLKELLRFKLRMGQCGGLRTTANHVQCGSKGVGVDRGGIKLVHGMGFVNAGLESLGDWVGSRFHSVRIWMGSGLGEVVVEVSQVSRGRGDLRLWWSRSGPARPHESGTTSQPSTRSRDHSTTS